MGFQNWFVLSLLLKKKPILFCGLGWGYNYGTWSKNRLGVAPKGVDVV